MRTEWVAQRSKDPIPTQIYYGRQGVVTEEMEYVARRERLSAETIRDEVARGRRGYKLNCVNDHRKEHTEETRWLSTLNSSTSCWRTIKSQKTLA